ncbi:MAG: M14 family zinc carboxypeptidase [Thermoplasmata archaeon]|nr:M14 family zinc carboxypeptidase [Thermoplasmata archaeon]
MQIKLKYSHINPLPGDECMQKFFFTAALAVVLAAILLSGQCSVLRTNLGASTDIHRITTVGGTWDKYHSYNSTNSLTLELFNLSAQHPDIMKVVSIGKTWKGRDIWAVKISSNVNVEDPTKPEVIFDGNHHAREWLTVEVCMYIIHKFVDEYGTNSTITNLVNTRQIWVVPTLNPDGRVYDGGGNDGIDPSNVKNWRKNLRDNNNNGQIDSYDGVDLNRNYEIGFGIGSSSSMSSETYMGPTPFSEKETQAYRDFLSKHHFITGITYHSYAQLILYPWAYTSTDTSHHSYFTAAANKIKSLIKNTAGSSYSWQAGQPPEILYAAGGSSFDYLYACYETFQFGIELYPSQSDSISDGFHPPTSKILPACNDQIEAAVYMVESAQNPYHVLGLSDDIGILKIEPFTNMSSYEGGTHSILAYVVNSGKNAQSGFDVRLNITKRNGSTSTLVYTNTTTLGNSLSQNQTAILSWNYNFNEQGTYNIKVETLKSDGYSANNKKEITVNITSTGGSDTTPPVISNVGASSITANSATVSWTTDEASSSVVEYGTTTAYGQTATGASGVTSHSVTLSGLTASTTYYYRVKSTDAAGNTATSSAYSFTTPAASDTTPPVISNVAVTGITANSATITWTTDEASTSVVEYGTTTSYGQTATGSGGVTSHSVTLSGLTATTTYHYRVKSTDSAGNLATSSDYTFTTAANSTDVIVLTDGVAVTGSLGAAKDAKYYLLDVGLGKTLLRIELTGPSGTDFDLYAKLGAKPTTSIYDARSIGSTSAETINVTNPSAGSWYFMVYSYSGSGTFTIKATTTTGTTNTTPLTDGVPATDYLSGTGKGKNYSINVPAGKKQLKIEMSGPSGTDFDIYVKFGTTASRTNYDYKSTSSSSTESVGITDPSNGTWYIYVYSYSGSGNFTIKATLYDTGTQDLSELISGEAKSATISTCGEKLYFHIAVPSSISSLTIELVGPANADFDLYVRLNSNPSTSAYDYRSVSSGSTETISIRNPSAGTWYIMIYAYSGTGTFEIRATISP